MKNGIPICLGYFAVSFAFGIQAADINLSPFQAGLLSLLNVTSAGQFAGLAVIASAGSYIEMAILQAIVNLRYLLMSAALSQKLTPETPTFHRLGIAYGVTDEIFGISVMRKGALSPYFSYGATLVSVFGWVSGTVLGASAGAILPQRLISALGIALYGMFIAIIIPPSKKDRNVGIAVCCSFALSGLCAIMPIISEWSSGTRTILLTILISSVVAWLRPIKKRESNGTE